MLARMSATELVLQFYLKVAILHTITAYSLQPTEL